MKWIPFTILLCILTVINAGNIPNLLALGQNNIRPDLLLIALVFFAVNSSRGEAVIISFAVGFAADISGSSVGINMLSYGLIGSCISLLRRVVIMQRMTHQAISIFIVSVGCGVLSYCFVFLKPGFEVPPLELFVLLGRSLYSAAAGPFVWIVLSMLWDTNLFSSSQHRKCVRR